MDTPRFAWTRFGPDGRLSVASARVVTASLPLGNAVGPLDQKVATASFNWAAKPALKVRRLWEACAEPVLGLGTIYGVARFCDAGRVFLKYVAGATA